MTTPTPNYTALGEHTAFSGQAKRAAERRITWINNLMHDLRRARDDNPQAIDTAALHARIDDIEQADIELRDALARTNRAGAECGQRALSVADLLRN